MNAKLKEDILKALEDSIINTGLIIDLRCLDIDNHGRLLDLYMKDIELSERLIKEIKDL